MSADRLQNTNGLRRIDGLGVGDAGGVSIAATIALICGMSVVAVVTRAAESLAFVMAAATLVVMAEAAEARDEAAEAALLPLPTSLIGIPPASQP